MKRHLIKIISLITIISTIIVAENGYSRLTKQERKQFTINYRDLITAYSSQNFKGFEIHSGLFLDRYKNILLDPNCAELRENYLQIEKLGKTIEKVIKHKQYVEDISIIKRGTPDIEDIELLDEYLKFLDDNNLDSLFNEEKKYYDNSIENIFRINNKDIEIYRKLCKARYVSKVFIQKEGKILERRFKEKISRLSSNMDINEIRKFKEENSEIFKDEIKQLEEKCRILDRQSLLKKDLNIDIIRDYKNTYPQRDDFFDTKIKSKYRNKIYKYKSLETFIEYIELFPQYDDTYKHMEKVLVSRALCGSLRDGVAYLNIFPNGKYAFELEGYIKTLHAEMVNNSIGTDIDGSEIRY